MPLAPLGDLGPVDQSEPAGPLPLEPCPLRFVTPRGFYSTLLMGPCYQEHQFALLLLGHSSSRSSSSSPSLSSHSFCFSCLADDPPRFLSLPRGHSTLDQRKRGTEQSFASRLFCLLFRPLLRPSLTDQRTRSESIQPDSILAILGRGTEDSCLCLPLRFDSFLLSETVLVAISL